MAKKKKPFIDAAIQHPGALHTELHVPPDQPIPHAKLVKASHSANPIERKRAELAETLSKFSHKK